MNLFSKLRRLARKIKENPLLSFLIGLLILAFGAFVGVLFFKCVGKCISELPGLSSSFRLENCLLEERLIRQLETKI